MCIHLEIANDQRINCKMLIEMREKYIYICRQIDVHACSVSTTHTRTHIEFRNEYHQIKCNWLEDICMNYKIINTTQLISFSMTIFFNKTQLFWPNSGASGQSSSHRIVYYSKYLYQVYCSLCQSSLSFYFACAHSNLKFYFISSNINTVFNLYEIIECSDLGENVMNVFQFFFVWWANHFNFILNEWE